MGGILWEEFCKRDFMGGILWEEICGRDSMGGILWEGFCGRAVCANTAPASGATADTAMQCDQNLPKRRGIDR